MRFREWLEDSKLLNEMPYARVVGDPNMNVYVGDDGYLHGQSIQADLIDFRFEDYGTFKRTAPANGVHKFSAPLADGKWLNVDIDFFPYGKAWVDSERSHEIGGKLKSEPYPSIAHDWATFAEFLFQNNITKDSRAGAMRSQAV